MADSTPGTFADRLNAGVWPSPWFVTSEDSLRVLIRTAIAVTVTIEGRFLDTYGSIHAFVEDFTPTATDRSANTFLFAQTYGWLLDLTARVTTGAPETGQTYVTVRMVRGQGSAAIPIGTIVAGYVTASVDLAWPGSPVVSSVAGPGVITAVSSAVPAAGAEITISVPTRARWDPLAMAFSLTTAVAVANREVALVIDDGATILARVPSSVSEVASTTTQYSYFRSPQRGAGAQDTSVIAPLPQLRLAACMRLRTITKNIQAADQYTAARLLVEEWIED